MKTLIVSFRSILIFSLLTGVLYPLAMLALARVFYSEKSRGSLLAREGVTVGSELIGQAFSEARYFWPRPSAVKYDAAGSGASNQGLTSADLIKAIREREAQGMTGEMRFASGSGLDPHISPEAARAQVARVVQARHLNPSDSIALSKLVEQYIEPRQMTFLGEPRVNVLSLNLKVDEQFKK